MRLSIFITVTEQILAHARRDHPREACGLLLGRSGVVEAVVPTANMATDPAREFEIDPAVLLRCHRLAREGGPEVVGWYHSHPVGRAEPSAVDSARAIEDGKVWLVVGADTLRAFLTQPGASRFRELGLDIVPG